MADALGGIFQWQQDINSTNDTRQVANDNNNSNNNNQDYTLCLESTLTRLHCVRKIVEEK